MRAPWVRIFSLYLGVAALFSQTAAALPSVAPRLRDNQLRLNLNGATYLSPSPGSIADNKTGNLTFSVAGRGLLEKNDFRAALEADGLIGLRRANYRYLNPSEGYAGYDNKTWNVYAGRKRNEWSELDAYWSQGLFDPRFRWDYLNDKPVGLLGLFGGVEKENFSVLLFYSPFFLPEQGAPISISGGECRSTSPWFNCPTSNISLFNVQTNIRYTLNNPPYSWWIMRESYGSSVRIGRKLGFYGRLSYAFKPMNQVLLAYTGQQDISTLQVLTAIYPRVLRHHIFGSDLGWKSERHSVVGSLVYEKPVRDSTPSYWNTQEVSNATLASITIKTMPFTQTQRFTRFELSYFHREGGNAADRGPFAQPGENRLVPRYEYKDAISFLVATPIWDEWARRFLLTTRFVVDTANQGNILTGDLYYSPFTHFFANLGIDILGSRSADPVDFMSRYQRNDRLRGGLAYAF